MRKLFAAVLLFALVSCAALAPAQEATPIAESGASCERLWLQVKDSLGRQNARVAEVTGEHAQILTAYVNDSPPQTDHKPDRVFIATKPGAPTAFIVLVAGACAVEGVEMPLDILRQILTRQPTALRGRNA